MIAKTDNRTIRRQVMVTESMNEKIINESRRFGLSISSYLELVIGNHLAKRESQILIDTQEI